MKARKLIKIPRRCRSWSLNQVPVSTRLRTALWKRGYRRLGALHGLTWKELSLVKGCGVSSVRELERLLGRLDAREFEKQAAVRPAAMPQRVMRLIDAFCGQIPGRERTMFLARLGAKRTPVTLAKVGDKYQLTRERVRQIVDAELRSLSRQGGPPFMRLLRGIIAKCQRPGRGSVQEQLSKWFSSHRLKQGHSTAFYVRVICQLRRFLRS